MSRTSRREQQDKAVAGPEGATPVGPMTLTGVVKTTRGYAVATAIVGPDGETHVELGPSQAFKEFAAAEHKRALMKAAMQA